MKKEFHNLYRKFGGVESLEQIPDALFVCDIKKDKIAVKEASEKGVPVIAIVDTNADPSAVDYPIPASDDALASIEYILDKVGRTIKQEQS